MLGKEYKESRVKVVLTLETFRVHPKADLTRQGLMWLIGGMGAVRSGNNKGDVWTLELFQNNVQIFDDILVIFDIEFKTFVTLFSSTPIEVTYAS